MNRRLMVAMVAAGGAATALGTNRPATAGNWASLELLNPVRMAVVGVPVTVDAQMLRHGVNPSTWMPAWMRLTHVETGDEVVVPMEVISEVHALVRGEVTLGAPGAYRMVTHEMGPEIDLGVLLAVEAGEGDVVSRLLPAPGSAVACAGGDTASAVETEILSGSFADPVLEVGIGTTVTWVNMAAVVHQVAFTDPALASSPMLHQGDAHSVTFDTPGSFNYLCPPHPHMTGTVRVG